MNSHKYTFNLLEKCEILLEYMRHKQMKRTPYSLQRFLENVACLFAYTQLDTICETLMQY